MKKDDSIQEYDRRKIQQSLVSAGTPPDQAERLLIEIESWLKTQNTPTVKSSDIRQKIVDSLRRVNPQATKGYKTHRKTK